MTDLPSLEGRDGATPQVWRTRESTRFPNKAGDHADTDEILSAELRAAGIPTLADEGVSAVLLGILREQSGEVKTSVRGALHGWKFERAWYYWMCSGPGIDVETAEGLHAAHGRAVRVAGHCGCPSPREWFKGLACGSYHVDDAEGLKALADTIKALAASPSAPEPQPRTVTTQEDRVMRDAAKRSAKLIDKGRLATPDPQPALMEEAERLVEEFGDARASFWNTGGGKVEIDKRRAALLAFIERAVKGQQ